MILEMRIRVEKYHDQGRSARWIAGELRRSPATVSRELRRGAWRPANTSAAYAPYRPGRLRTGPWTGLRYRAGQAQRRAEARAALGTQPRADRPPGEGTALKPLRPRQCDARHGSE
ncbi:MAG: helix-turn-helix domain-containing protein [Bifidobacteriaceae bacterium]|nr:helix-turn-helix domain-containing protein [Bifidobacteriaceae bacterium]